jgi:K+-sensing histidine kinase KdpD
VDAKIGYIETHGRKRHILDGGHPLLPRRKLFPKQRTGRTGCAGCHQPASEIVLIDQRPNIEGSKNEKRWRMMDILMPELT